MSRSSGGRSRRDCRFHVQASETRVAANGGDELVTGSWLWNGEAMLVQEPLEIGLGPLIVEPVSGIEGCLTEFLGNGFVVLAGLGQEGITLAGLRGGDAIPVKELLELGIGPAG